MAEGEPKPSQIGACCPELGFTVALGMPRRDSLSGGCVIPRTAGEALTAPPFPALVGIDSETGASMSIVRSVTLDAIAFMRFTALVSRSWSKQSIESENWCRCSTNDRSLLLKTPRRCLHAAESLRRSEICAGQGARGQAERTFECQALQHRPARGPRAPPHGKQGRRHPQHKAHDRKELGRGGGVLRPGLARALRLVGIIHPGRAALCSPPRHDA